jgi:ribosomal protein S18 acetylase RimI-like enzyme
MTMIIRPAELQDKEGADIVRATVLSQNHPYHYEQNIGLAETLNLVAEKDGIIVGFVSVLLSRCNPQGQHLWERVAPYIAFIGVMAGQQKKGIGNLLLRSAINGAAIRCPNEPVVYLEYEIESEARRLYERIGFRTVSHDEILMATGLHPKGPVMGFDLERARKMATLPSDELL